MKGFRNSLLAVILLLIIGLTIILIIRTSPPSRYPYIREGFMSIPHDIDIRYRDTVSDFLDLYFDIGKQICAVQSVVIDGIAKTIAGVGNGESGTVPKVNLSAAQTRAKAMANGPILDCIVFQKQLDIVNKGDLNIKDLYDIIDNIPDDIGARFVRSLSFSESQLKDTYEKVKNTISSATAGVIPAPTTTAIVQPAPTKTEGYADLQEQQQQPSRCKSTEKCPEEMAREISDRIQRIYNNLTQTSSYYASKLKSANDYLDKLNELKKKAESGNILSPPATTSSTSA